jgi:tetratricopeptide (TPR) repeat protein
VKKASVISCLFLLVLISPVRAQQWRFDSLTQRAYQHVLNLEFQTASTLLSNPKTPQEHYVISYGEALDLLLTEDADKFHRYEQNFEKRINKKSRAKEADQQFLKAELHLQWAFVYLKFEKELDAAKHFREAYKLATDCRERFPDYVAIRKTTGLLEIIIGSVPEKYNWILNLLNMEGTTALGLKELNGVKTSASPLALEADLLLCLVQGYIFQKPEIGLAEVKNVLEKNPNQRLTLFLAASLAMKNFQSEEALDYLKTIDPLDSSIPIHYSAYLKGEIYLHKGEYQYAIDSYRLFRKKFKGQNNIKDAAYKIGLCYLLEGNQDEAKRSFSEAKSVGKEVVEADKSAARTLSENTYPNVKLAKVRYATDGGYYESAQHVLSTISDIDLPTRKNQVEFYYRKARLEHRLGRIEPAKLFYRQVIDMAGAEHWYFAPNACLQMGYIYSLSQNKSEARGYFEKALTYKRHEYKNSIDSKARSALGQLK